MNNSVYLIDYENICYRGLYGISNLNSGDEIIIFYSKDISIIKDIINIYEKSEITIRYFNLNKSGKNALDFMICAYAGYSASKSNVEKIAFISNDKEYTSIISVIKSINPDVEIAFESCIYNVIYPENKKEFVSVQKSGDTDNSEKAVKSIKKESDTEKLPELTQEYLKKQLLNRNKIPEKYINQIVGIMLKSLSKNISENEFTSLINKSLGKKTDNDSYRKTAQTYYKELRKKYHE